MTIRARPLLAAAMIAASGLAAPLASAGGTLWAGETFAGEPCHMYASPQAFGPFDYTDPTHRRQHLEIVERFHFTDDVRALRRGVNATHPLNDLEYTIRAFPNHHAALASLVRYATSDRFAAERKRAWETPVRGGRLRPPTECYLQRATAFAPTDHRAHLLTGIFFHKLGHTADAERAYGRALELAPGSAEAHYNLGLLLADQGHYAKARDHAARAYALGHPLPGLRVRLQSVGVPINP